MAKGSEVTNKKNWFGKIHLGIGFFLFVLFLITGQYMDRNFNHLADMDDLPRATMRAGHLYLLLCAIIFMCMGAYVKISKSRTSRILQIIGSCLLWIGTSLLIYSFFTELPSDSVERPISRLGLYAMLGGGLFHGTNGLLSE